jgi:hypothetical protein
MQRKRGLHTSTMVGPRPLAYYCTNLHRNIQPCLPRTCRALSPLLSQEHHTWTNLKEPHRTQKNHTTQGP